MAALSTRRIAVPYAARWGRARPNTAVQNTIAPAKKLNSAAALSEALCTIQTYGSGRCQKMKGTQKTSHAHTGWHAVLPMRLSTSDRLATRQGRADTNRSGATMVSNKC